MSVELNKRISDLTDQDHTLSEMNKLGFVNPDIFISQRNDLYQKITAAKQEKERLIGMTHDDIIPKTRELMENLESMPNYLSGFDPEIFVEIVERITVINNETLLFKLSNGMELREKIERTVR